MTPVNAFKILSGDGTRTIGSFDAALGDVVEDAMSVRQKLNALKPGEYWLVTARCDYTSLASVTVTENDGMKVAVTTHRHSRSALGPNVADAAKKTIFSDRTSILLSERKFPGGVVNAYIAMQH